MLENNNNIKQQQLQEENDVLKSKVRDLEQELSTHEAAAKENKKKTDLEMMELRKKLRDTETKYTNLASTPPKVLHVIKLSLATNINYYISN